MAVAVETALATLLEKITITKTKRLPLSECYARVIAEDIIAGDFPPFDRSPLDGYAVRMADIYQATPQCPAVLRQVDYIPAGTWPKKVIGPGQAARIMTGGKIPEGADAVVRIEDTTKTEDMVTIFNPQGADKNICYRGEEFQSGEIALMRGTLLNAGALGMLAMMGQAAPLVYERPQVGILATGSELVPVSTQLRPGAIYDSNSYMLMAKVLSAGGQPVLLGQAKDNIEDIAAVLTNKPGLQLYITTGGASVGDYDLMEELFNKLDIPILFQRVAMKPGMPVLAGVWQGALIIALSGNPAACSVSFEVLVKPLIKKMAGMAEWRHKWLMVELAGDFKKPSPARRFVWARAYADNCRLLAEPLFHQGNGMLKAAVSANVLLDISANSPPLTAGTTVEALLLD